MSNADEKSKNGAPLAAEPRASTSPIRLGGLRNAGRVLDRLHLQVTRVAQTGASNRNQVQQGFWRVSLPKTATMSSADRTDVGGENSNKAEETVHDGPMLSLQREMMSYHEVVLKKLVANGNIRLACQFAGCYEACQRLVVGSVWWSVLSMCVPPAHHVAVISSVRVEVTYLGQPV